MEYIKCDACGAKNILDSDYCYKCGKLITKNIICPKCGKILELESNFCNICGCSLNKKTVLSINALRNILIVLCVLVVLLACGIIIWYFV